MQKKGKQKPKIKKSDASKTQCPGLKNEQNNFARKYFLVKISLIPMATCYIQLKFLSRKWCRKILKWFPNFFFFTVMSLMCAKSWCQNLNKPTINSMERTGLWSRPQLSTRRDSTHRHLLTRLDLGSTTLGVWERFCRFLFGNPETVLTFWDKDKQVNAICLGER